MGLGKCYNTDGTILFWIFDIYCDFNLVWIEIAQFCTLECAVHQTWKKSLSNQNVEFESVLYPFSVYLCDLCWFFFPKGSIYLPILNNNNNNNIYDSKKIYHYHALTIKTIFILLLLLLYYL